MEEIEIGEYVRTEEGKIIKVTKFGTLRKEFSSETSKVIFSGRVHYKYKNIVKHSKNIIDLIEVGDYVNGGQVREIGKDYIRISGVGKDYIRISGGGYIWQFVKKEEIKSILTKEQYDANCYRLEE